MESVMDSDGIIDLQDIPVYIDPPSHLFHDPNAWDPRKEDSSGGYLQGEIHLPLKPSMKVVISAYPAFKYDDNMVMKNNAVERFQPSLIYLARKKEGRLQYNKMPVPNLHHYRMELDIQNRDVFVNNYLSKEDHGRDINKRDFLFTISDVQDERLILRMGTTDKELNSQILYAKTDNRSNANAVTLNRMIKDRGLDQEEVSKYFKKKDIKNKYRIKLMVEVFVPGENDSCDRLYGRGFSQNIIHSRSKFVAPLKIYGVIPQFSCSSGGCWIAVLSECPLSKDVVVEFQLWDITTGKRVPKEESENLLDIKHEGIKVNNWMIFLSPAVNENILRDYKIKIALTRESEEDTTEGVEFEFKVHDDVFDTCQYCELGIRRPLPQIEQAKPGKKKLGPKKQVKVPRYRQVKRKNTLQRKGNQKIKRNIRNLDESNELSCKRLHLDSSFADIKTDDIPIEDTTPENEDIPTKLYETDCDGNIVCYTNVTQSFEGTNNSQDTVQSISQYISEILENNDTSFMSDSHKPGSRAMGSSIEELSLCHVLRSYGSQRNDGSKMEERNFLKLFGKTVMEYWRIAVIIFIKTISDRYHYNV